MAKFNEHKNYNAWNVSLWLNNDEKLYRAMQYYTEHHNRKDAATKMFNMLRCKQGTTKPQTRDGAPYSITNIMLAMRGM
jgi:hypothetical protein